MSTATDEPVTLYEGAIEPDENGDPQPVAEIQEDEDPLGLAGEELAEQELPDEELPEEHGR